MSDQEENKKLSKLERLKLEREFQRLRRMNEDAKTNRRIHEIQAKTDAQLAQAATHLITLLDSFRKAGCEEPEPATVEELKTRLRSYSVMERQLARAIQDLGIEEIGGVGEQVDSKRHHVERTRETDDAEDGIILEVVEAGYSRNDKLIRPAKVVVAVNQQKDEQL